MFLSQVFALLYREWLIFYRKFFRYFFQFTISPLLYLITFGWAGSHQQTINGISYINFMLPGLIAMSSMINSFSISTEINISRFYWKTFDEIRSAPVCDHAYALGEIASGMMRGTIAAFIVVFLGCVFSKEFFLNFSLFAGMILNTFVFSSVAVSTAMLAKSHADQGMLNNFVITPMAFLCGTFFPVENYPFWVKWLINILPLTHATNFIRSAALGLQIPCTSLLYLSIFGILAFVFALSVIRKSKN